ncbi:sodium:solute symporter [Halobacillus andaensis]|uniref:Sodium:solute symporter n=1 Tax=Halobacillus andaensis TaxID=1176239 RepID=A0A917EUJ4_HALAA|nr:sodium:solute symporter family protein [Halobacillus andaensis]MBP2003898.1 SSS family solute:Na+ symporter [Halobacillus andaensis]GGF14119.1 sodium:solute symporter [Halobacillus andaensis]
MNVSILVPLVLVYIGIMSWLAYYGYKKTVTKEDFLVGGRNTNPIIMALSYGATFISTSAMVGFGGVASVYGMGLLWLAFLNIVLGIFVAFAVFGKRIRKMSSKMNATTFPTFLGKHYDSKFITVFSGIMIFIFMPAYTSIVLIGGGRFLQESLAINFNVALLILAFIVAVYVISGGIKAVMYTDAFGAVIMLIGMSIFLFVTYHAVGGLFEGHQALQAMKSMVPEDLAADGHNGWMSMPDMGSPMWWTLVSTMILGVGIGVLAQPQLAMRSMTVSSNKSLYRSVIVGGIFIFFMAGAAYIIGPLSNVYFMETNGQLAIQAAEGNTDLVIPRLISELMPEWFVYLFTLTLISATLSTVSSLIHVQSSAFGEDILRTIGVKKVFSGKISTNRLGVIVGMVLAVVLAYALPGGIIAQATAFWFGICAAGFLPALTGALFWKGSSKQGASASMIVGFSISVFGFLFLKSSQSTAFGVSQALFGRDFLLPYPWTHIDPLVYALPLSTIVFVGVSVMTKSKEKTGWNKEKIDAVQ